MQSDLPEAEVRKHIDRLLDYAGWLSSEISEEENVQTGRVDYRLGDLCILEAKRPTLPNQDYRLKMHLQQAQRYHESAKNIPFLMVSDGNLHFIQDTRYRRIERLFTIPSKKQLQTVLDDPDALRDGDIIPPPSLFEFQKKSLHEVVRQIVEGRTRLLLEMATGTGKTVVAAEIINQMNRIWLERYNRRVSVLFLVDRDALEEQSAVKLGRDVVSALKVNTVDHLMDNGKVDVLVAQVATMQNRYDRAPFNSNYFDLIIIDEAHRSIHGGVWRRVVEYFQCPQVGLTATPPRFKDDETVEYFGPPVFRFTYEDGVLSGVLAPYVIHRVKTNIDRDGLIVGEEYFQSEDFGVAVQVDNRDWAITRYYEKHFYGKKCLIFAAGTQHVESLWEKFNTMFGAHEEGYKAQFVVSSVESPAARLNIVDEFVNNNSDVKVLINLNILTAGFDYPELDLLFLCRYTQHKSLYLQMKGRGARLPFDSNGQLLIDENGNPIKDRFVMADFVGVTDWENRDVVLRVPRDEIENAAEDFVNIDPQSKDRAVPSVDVPVEIAEVEIIDPFEGEENPIARHLRSQLESAKLELRTVKSELSLEQSARHEQEQVLATLQHAAETEKAKRYIIQRDAFRQFVLSLHAFAPFVPITETLLYQINPSLQDLDSLNEVFGTPYGSVQEHIDAVLIESFVKTRYHELVERKHTVGLNQSEETEMERLAKELDELDEEFYRPILSNLRELLNKKQSEGNQ
jgi:type I site-specific restriction endonuclease